MHHATLPPWRVLYWIIATLLINWMNRWVPARNEWVYDVRDLLWGPGGEMTHYREALSEVWDGGYIGYDTETRGYNSRGQLTALQRGGMNLEYRYPSGTNNGQISSMKNWVSGEEVVYQYDELHRLARAETTGPQWGLQFAYDGYGNRTAQTVVKGAGPNSSLSYNAKNQMVGFAYDANGNQLSMPLQGTLTYDAYNRLTGAGPGHARESYSYAPDNKRLMRMTADGKTRTFFWFGGMLLGDYEWMPPVGSMPARWEVRETHSWFGGRKVFAKTDRLGSDVGATGGRYYPYGEESQPTGQDRLKFATYRRDATGLDHADQRYYASTLGRFLTADPYRASAGAGDPQSWNRYSYVQGDPVNWVDPAGLTRCPPNSQTCVDVVDFIDAPSYVLLLQYWTPRPERSMHHATRAAPGLGPNGRTPRQQDFINVNNRLKRQLAEALGSLHADCTKALEAQGISIGGLRQRSLDIRFYDASTSHGGLTGHDILRNGSFEKLQGIQYGSKAFILRNRAGTLSSVVVVRENFYGGEVERPIADQNATLIHELLHVFSNLNDEQLFNKLDIGEMTGNPSAAISSWLRGNCQ